MNVNVQSVTPLISFHGKKSKSSNRHYSYKDEMAMQEIKAAALENGWIDPYTGEPFSESNPPTIDHLKPYCEGNKKKLRQQGFDINGLSNLFLAGADGNNERGDTSFLKTACEKPCSLDRLVSEMANHYINFNSPHVNGENWVKGLGQNILANIDGYVADVYGIRGILEKLKTLIN